jgi:hypothetical protein
MKRILTMSVLAAAVLATGCTRIETGEVTPTVATNGK